MSNAQAVNAENFEQEVLKSDIPVLVDFWAPWCGPCKALAPTIDDVANETAGRLKVVKLDIDEAPGVAAKYGVQSIPTLILFKNGDIVEQLVGMMPKTGIMAKVAPHL